MFSFLLSVPFFFYYFFIFISLHLYMCAIRSTLFHLIVLLYLITSPFIFIFCLTPSKNCIRFLFIFLFFVTFYNLPFRLLLLFHFFSLTCSLLLLLSIIITLYCTRWDHFHFMTRCHGMKNIYFSLLICFKNTVSSLQDDIKRQWIGISSYETISKLLYNEKLYTSC